MCGGTGRWSPPSLVLLILATVFPFSAPPLSLLLQAVLTSWPGMPVTPHNLFSLCPGIWSETIMKYTLDTAFLHFGPWVFEAQQGQRACPVWELSGQSQTTARPHGQGLSGLFAQNSSTLAFSSANLMGVRWNLKVAHGGRWPSTLTWAGR